MTYHGAVDLRHLAEAAFVRFFLYKPYCFFLLNMLSSLIIAQPRLKLWRGVLCLLEGRVV